MRSGPRLHHRLGTALAIGASLVTAPLLAQRGAARPVDAVRGQVYDSLAGKPLAGASVRITPRDDDDANGLTAVTDADGRFRIASASPGTWQVRFTHPALQVLGLDLAPDILRITTGATANIQLAVPSASTVREAYCAAMPATAGSAVIVGYVRGTPVRDATDSLVVLATWSRTGTAAPVARDSIRRIVAVAADGWYGLCAGDAARSVTLSVVRGSTLVQRDTVVLPASGVLVHALDVRALPVGMTTTGLKTTAPRAAQTITVSGVVLAADDRTPIAGATVALSGIGATRTDAQGRWTFRDAPPGARTVTIRAVGYALQSRERLLDATTPLIADTLRRIATMLDEVNVRAEALTPSLRAFQDRSRTRGTGTFLMRDDIASRRPTFLSDLFPSVQGGIRIERDSLGNKWLTMRSNTLRASSCFPAIFIDGMHLRGLTTADLDGIVRPSELFGVEIYRAANAPVEFNHQDGCGTILIWTTALQAPP
jgi:hypothetical protein